MLNKKEFIKSTLDWYDEGNRILPWRSNPLPYYVWISEIMLQQTRVEAVIPFFNRFIQSVPDIKTLSIMEDDNLNKLWEGLGYYSRVRNLKKAAIIIIKEHNGELPKTKKELESLPGIGPYTSGAILSIAYNQKVAAVDGNVLRVFARLLGLKESIKDKNIKILIKDTVEELLPNKRNGDFNQALMEIGAMICIPNGTPKCEVCPHKKVCVANLNGVANEIPVKMPKKKRRVEQRTVLVIKFRDKILLNKRPNNGLLAGLYEFPNMDGHVTENEIVSLYKNEVLSITELPKSKHLFTHIEWHMIGYMIELKNEVSGLHWKSKQEIMEELSVPTAFKKYKNYL